MSFRNIFVTVGTTEFDQLIKYLATEEMLNIFIKLNCQHLTVQLGNGNYEKYIEDFNKFVNYNIKFSFYRLKDSIIEDIINSDLVISHAGAGTCIDVLSHNKPLIVVINENLMNNHQIELAEQLANDGYLFHCTISSLKNMLGINFNKNLLKPYTPGNAKEFVQYLNDFVSR